MKNLLSFLPRGQELPLWMWVIGFAEFLLQTTTPLHFPVGVLSWTLFIFLCIAVVFQNGRSWVQAARASFSVLWAFRGHRLLTLAYGVNALFLLFLFLLGLFAALRPPHFSQEYDAVHYQMGVPWQHLVIHSLRWIGWPVTDLWPMALQWGLAPYQHAFATVNKLPQLIYAAGTGVCLYHLAAQLSAETPNWRVCLLPVFAFLGGHGVVTQLGMGMYDLPFTYLLLLAVSALLDRRWVTAAAALAVFTASKAFNPFLVAPALAGGFAWLWLGKSSIEPVPVFRRFLPFFLAFSLLLFARPALVSLEFTGTPLFPFAACKITNGKYCTPEKSGSLDSAAATLLSTRDNYGFGRGPAAFLRHLWRIAIPTNAVNNEYDYPLGLPWLLLEILLGASLLRGGWRSPMIQLTLLFWALWWLNAHQSRWLYPVIAFGFLATLREQTKVKQTLPFLLALSMAFSLISMTRAIQLTWKLSRFEIQQQEEGKVRWAAPGTLESVELLYVNEPAPRHSPGATQWVLP